jgi:hypothetical protein
MLSCQWFIENTQPPIMWVVGTDGSFPGGKPAGREAHHSRPCSAEVKNAWSYTSILPYHIMAWFLTKKQMRLIGMVFG